MHSKKTSKFVLDSKVSAAKYKTQGLRDLMDRAKMQDKASFLRMEERVKKMSTSHKASAMNDDYAQDFFSMAKMSRAKETKQREAEERDAPERQRWHRRREELESLAKQQRLAEELEREKKSKKQDKDNCNISSSTIKNQDDSSSSDENDNNI